LVACLLNADRVTAASILSAVCDDDFADHRLRGVLALARRVVDDGAPPEPGILLATARAAGDVTTPESTRDLAFLLADLAGAVTVVASWAYYLRAVVEDAVRRRVAEAGARFTQAAETESLDSLVALVDRESATVRELAARREPTPTPLRAVP
jgi:replicative DNA helicase